MSKPLFFTLLAALAVQLGTSLPTSAQDIYGKGIQEIRIEIPHKDWDWKLDSLKTVNPESRLLATAFVNGTRFDSVGVRYKGNSSYFRSRKDTSRKLPINVKLNYRMREQQLKEGQNTLKLSNAFLDPSFLRDPLAYNIIRRYMPAPACNFAKVFINKDFYGLYVNTESIDNVFIQKHFGSTAGYLIKCDPDNWKRVRSQSGCPKGENASLMYLNDSPGCYDAFYEVDNPASWKPLINFVKILNKEPEKIESVLNIDQTLWMHALNNVIVNLDSYTGSLSHNYYLWIDSIGVAHPLIWDLNMAFGGWRRDFSFNSMSDQELIEYSPVAEFGNAKRPLISKLLRTPLYRKMYIAHIKTIVNDCLVSNQWLKDAEAMMKEIDPWVKKDSLKLYPYETFKNSLDSTMVVGPDKVIGLRQLLERRAKYLVRHPALSKPQPTIGKVAHTVQADSVLVTAAMSSVDSALVYYRKYKMYAFGHAPLNDKGENGDVTAGDGIFSARLPKADVIHYYVVAENAEAATLFPERASFEFLKVE
ncbi:MAG: CotH kinase family protein [Saprospiraceae bacterium]